MTKDERFIVETVFPESGGVGSPVVKDTMTGERVSTEEYEIANLLNKLTDDNHNDNSSLYELNALNLIKLKQQRLEDMESKYYEVISRETDLKNAENELYLQTDFKELKLTNDKLRNSYVSKATNELRLKLDLAKYELKQQENLLIIINDLIALRMKEVKTEWNS